MYDSKTIFESRKYTLKPSNFFQFFAFYWWSKIVQLFIAQGWLSELRGPGLLMDLIGICLWYLKPESKADLSLTNFFLKEKSLLPFISLLEEVLNRPQSYMVESSLLKVLLLLLCCILHMDKMRKLQLPANQCLILATLLKVQFNSCKLSLERWHFCATL